MQSNDKNGADIINGEAPEEIDEIMQDEYFNMLEDNQPDSVAPEKDMDMEKEEGKEMRGSGAGQLDSSQEAIFNSY